jgi:hypothetical protein
LSANRAKLLMFLFRCFISEALFLCHD